ncbi:MIB2-like protein, partial [Mya arenaria]
IDILSEHNFLKFYVCDSSRSKVMAHPITAALSDSPAATLSAFVRPAVTPLRFVRPAATLSPYDRPAVTLSSFVKPAVTLSKYVELALNLSPYVRPAATPSPFVRPAATPSPFVRPASTPSPFVRPAATPFVRPASTPSPFVRPASTLSHRQTWVAVVLRQARCQNLGTCCTATFCGQQSMYIYRSMYASSTLARSTQSLKRDNTSITSAPPSLYLDLEVNQCLEHWIVSKMDFSFNQVQRHLRAGIGDFCALEFGNLHQMTLLISRFFIKVYGVIDMLYDNANAEIDQHRNTEEQSRTQQKMLGLRVVRGPNWQHGDQDGGEDHVGTVVEVNGANSVIVVWDMGCTTVCRGGGGEYDLRVFDGAPVGICHPIACVACEDVAVFGTIWRCATCTNVTLCSPCYHDDKHDISHEFVRLDLPKADPVTVPKRASSQRSRSMGIFPNALVKRGAHWEYGDQDGKTHTPSREMAELSVFILPRISEIEIAIIDGTKDIRFFGVGIGDIALTPSPTRELQVDSPCLGLTCMGCQMFVVCDKGLFVYDLAGNLVKKMYENFWQDVCAPDHVNVHYIAVSEDGQRIYITNQKKNSLVTIASPGHVSEQTHHDFSGPEGVYVGKRGTVFVCGSASHTILQADGKGKRITVFATEMDGLNSPRTVCFRSDTSELIVGQRGSGHEGSVEDIVNFGQDASDRNAARVTWKNRHTHVYRVGYSGKMDLMCTEEAPGLSFYPKHLAVLDIERFAKWSKSGVPLCVGEQVCVTISLSELKQLQQGSWNNRFEEIIGEVGVVESFTSEGDVVVDYDGDVYQYGKGDLVKVIGSKEKVRRLQKNHGGWDDDMNDVLGDALVPLEQGKEDASDDDDDDEGDAGAGLLQMFAGLALLQALADATSESNPRQALVDAIENNQVDDVREILEQQPELKDFKPQGIPLLSIATFKGHDDVIKVLLEEGADIDEEDSKGSTPLLIAIGNTSSATLLLQRGANVNDVVGDTPLHDAICERHDATTSILIEDTRVNVWLQNNKNFNPMHLACLKQYAFAVDKLLTREPGLGSAPKNDGFTPLHIAAFNNHVAEATVLLIKGRVEINARTHEKATPLMLGASQAHFDITKLLLEYEADFDLKDKDGDTALHMCMMGRRTDQVIGKEEYFQHFFTKSTENLIYSKQLLVVFNNKPTKPERHQTRPKTAKVEKEIFTTAKQMCHKCSALEATVRFEPCKHKVSCEKCCFRFKKCPICQKDIRKRVDKMFMNITSCMSVYLL